MSQLKKCLNELVKMGIMTQRDAQQIESGIFAIEPSSVEELKDWDVTDWLKETVLKKILDAYKKDSKGETMSGMEAIKQKLIDAGHDDLADEIDANTKNFRKTLKKFEDTLGELDIDLKDFSRDEDQLSGPIKSALDMLDTKCAELHRAFQHLKSVS